MSVAIFLDVDNTLTKEYIQEEFSKLLDVHSEYQEIENDFQNEDIDSSEFGNRIIALFRSKGFNYDFAYSNYNKIPKQDYTDKLLSLPVDIFLVSSGPNFYIDLLADEYNIPHSNILCSEYQFDNDGLIENCIAVNSNRKANFVLNVKHNYNLTIGVGDNELKDGPFLSNCDIPILTNRSNSFFSIDKSLESLFVFLERYCSINSRPKDKLLQCFIGSTTEKSVLATKLQGLLNEFCLSKHWKDAFRDRKTFISNLENIIFEYDFAVYFITPDDLVFSRGRLKEAIRDNIIFEIGMFYGAIGRERCFLLAPKNLDVDYLPSDLRGISFIGYNDQVSKENIKDILRPIADEIKDIMENLGVRK